MKTSQQAVAAGILAVALVLGIRHEIGRRDTARSVAELRARVAGERARTVALEAEAARLGKSIESDGKAVADAERRRTRIARDAAAASADPAAGWNLPPESWPSWDPRSPYVWVDKRVLPQLPISGLAFGVDGKLSAATREILAIDDATAVAVDAKLGEVLRELRDEVVAHAKPIEEHLAPIAGRPGDKLTIQLVPGTETSSRLRGEFERSLADGLGVDRSRVLLETAGQWMNETFNAFDGDGKTISVAWLPDGSESIAIQSSAGSMNTSGPGVVASHLPSYLLGLFKKKGDR